MNHLRLATPEEIAAQKQSLSSHQIKALVHYGNGKYAPPSVKQAARQNHTFVILSFQMFWIIVFKVHEVEFQINKQTTYSPEKSPWGYQVFLPIGKQLSFESFGFSTWTDAIKFALQEIFA